MVLATGLSDGQQSQEENKKEGDFAKNNPSRDTVCGLLRGQRLGQRCKDQSDDPQSAFFEGHEDVHEGVPSTCGQSDLRPEDSLCTLAVHRSPIPVPESSGSYGKQMMQRIRRFSSDSTNSLLRVDEDEPVTADKNTKIRIECCLKEDKWYTVGFVEVRLQDLLTHMKEESSVLVLPMMAHETFPWVVKTADSPLSANLGRTYVFRSYSHRKRLVWLLALADLKVRLDREVDNQRWRRAREHLHTTGFLFFALQEMQKLVKQVYHGPIITTLMMIVIVMSFITAAILWEMEESYSGEVAEGFGGFSRSFISSLELVFVIIFTVELAMAFFAEFPTVSAIAAARHECARASLHTRHAEIILNDRCSFTIHGTTLIF